VVPEETRAERAARAVRKVQPNRIQEVYGEPTAKHKHKHNPNERLRPDAPYSEFTSESTADMT
jgi:hypothetical protein